MSVRVQLACAWCGPAMVVVTLFGWLLSGILPLPPRANDSAADTVAFYAGDPNLTRLGLIITTLGLSLIGPLVAVIAAQMLRIEGRTPILTLLQLVSGAVTWVMLLVPMLILAVAGFRPDRSPELTQLLTDLGWLLFLTPIAPFIIQNISIGAAVLGDRRPTPVLPRWVGFTNFWVAFLFCPAVLSYFFRSGPLAWHGVFVFWLGVTAYTVWAFAMSITLMRAIKSQSPEGTLADSAV